MRCRSYQRKLSPYIDQELPETGRRSVEAHLSVCPACRAVLARLMRVRNAFSLRSSPGPLPEFADRTLARLGTGRAESRTGWRSFGRLAVAALVLIAVTGASAYWLELERESPAKGIVARYLEGSSGEDAPEFAVLYESDVSRDAVLKVAIQKK